LPSKKINKEKIRWFIVQNAAHSTLTTLPIVLIVGFHFMALALRIGLTGMSIGIDIMRKGTIIEETAARDFSLWV
jgi:hypothetical protein